MHTLLFLFRSSLISTADWMVSPMILVFCTPDVKIPSGTNNTVLSRSPETNELPLASHTETPQFPNFETRWLKTEAKMVSSNYVHLHTLFTINAFLNVSLGFFFSATFS